VGFFCGFFALIVTFFVSTMVSYDQKKLLDIRTEIINLDLDEDLNFNYRGRHVGYEPEWISRLYPPFYWRMYKQ
jgi:hypothetical protein